MFDISLLKAKRRYEINKGNKFFYAKRISPGEYIDRINYIREKKFATYPEAYKTKNNPEAVRKLYSENYDESKWITIGAFNKENNLLCGYLDVEIRDGYLDFVRMCVEPESEPLNINFALVCEMLSVCEPYLENGIPISDGQRNIKHKTSFQEWLIKYFDFRYAYCEMHMKLTPLGKLVYMLFKPFEKSLTNSNNSRLYDLSVFLRLYDCSIECKKEH